MLKPLVPRRRPPRRDADRERDDREQRGERAPRGHGLVRNLARASASSAAARVAWPNIRRTLAAVL